MEWIKIKGEHISSEYTNAEVGALVRFQLFIAKYGRYPSEVEIRREIGKKDFGRLKETLSRYGVSIELIQSKVEEDREKIQRRREVSRDTSRRYRAKQESDTSLPTSRDVADKIREDKRRNTTEQSSASSKKVSKKKDMWREYKEPEIDLETGETIPLEDEKMKKAERELRAKIRKKLTMLAEHRGNPYNPKAMNADVRTYQQLLAQGWSDGSIIDAYLDRINDSYWKEQRKKGNYPFMGTVEHQLRNKKPK